MSTFGAAHFQWCMSEKNAWFISRARAFIREWNARYWYNFRPSVCPSRNGIVSFPNPIVGVLSARGHSNYYSSFLSQYIIPTESLFVTPYLRRWYFATKWMFSYIVSFVHGQRNNRIWHHLRSVTNIWLTNIGKNISRVLSLWVTLQRPTCLLIACSNWYICAHVRTSAAADLIHSIACHRLRQIIAFFVFRAPKLFSYNEFKSQPVILIENFIACVCCET